MSLMRCIGPGITFATDDGIRSQLALISSTGFLLARRQAKTWWASPSTSRTTSRAFVTVRPSARRIIFASARIRIGRSTPPSHSKTSWMRRPFFRWLIVQATCSPSDAQLESFTAILPRSLFIRSGITSVSCRDAVSHPIRCPPSSWLGFGLLDPLRHPELPDLRDDERDVVIGGAQEYLCLGPFA
jgi:hypothetical protein